MNVGARAISGAPRIADAMAFAATPVFAALAVLELFGEKHPLCSGMQGGFHGMATMYGVMAFFHLQPWLSLCAKRNVAIA